MLARAQIMFVATTATPLPWLCCRHAAPRLLHAPSHRAQRMHTLAHCLPLPAAHQAARRGPCAHACACTRSAQPPGSRQHRTETLVDTAGEGSHPHAQRAHAASAGVDVGSRPLMVVTRRTAQRGCCPCPSLRSLLSPRRRPASTPIPTP